MDLKSKIILISGPTASGKSELAIKFAKKINGEIINADSMQVYKELKILTARPIKENTNKIKHHLYGFQSVKNEFSTGQWLKLVKKKIKEIRNKNKIPILVGGTGLYFKALTDGLVKIPKIPNAIRNKIRSNQKQMGQKKFYLKLLKLDKFVKNKIVSTDIQRSLRAYEVIYFTKKSIFEWYKKTKSQYKINEFLKIYIDYPKEILVNKISKRVDQMIKDGAVEEVQNFEKLNLKSDNNLYKVIGIREIKDFIHKKTSLKEMKQNIVIKTRQYAKRQRTWSRGQMSDWQKFDPNELSKFIKKL
ncbi:tRNA (adenosine(37)-N6)-dimethylallyltransferase MiaA [Candidatus Pelagibacter sp.]|nr:tRNA (adenosine(37)-N6)-dimethylallyltransferase MiaA [Candidatus Pelagibacter sp.]